MTSRSRSLDELGDIFFYFSGIVLVIHSIHDHNKNILSTFHRLTTTTTSTIDHRLPYTEQAVKLYKNKTICFRIIGISL